MTYGLFAALAALAGATIGGDAPRWWPLQAVPEAVVYTTNHEAFEAVEHSGGEVTHGAFGATHILVQSMAGLAARAVNEGRSDELVWVTVGHPDLGLNPDYAALRERAVGRLELEERGTFGPWELLERMIARGLVKGYALYRHDFSEGGFEQERDGIDPSVNAATMAASALGAVLIEEAQEARARRLGLERLYDAREAGLDDVFNTFAGALNIDGVVLIDPKVPNLRDLAVAHGFPVTYGRADPTPAMLRWVRPPASAFGWNAGDEHRQVEQLSVQGHFLTAANRLVNVPVLSAGSEAAAPPRFRGVDPAAIDYDDGRAAVAFLMSDGDNVNWYLGELIKSPSYWANEHHGAFPFGWSICAANLAQCAPDALHLLAETQPPATGMVQFLGGYFYADRFGEERGGLDLLREHARRVGHHIARQGIRVIVLIVDDVDGARAMAAYGVLAEEITGLAGILAMQYAPYNAGEGDVYWVRNAAGVELPVVTARYSLWADRNEGLRGTPARVARLINADAAERGDALQAWTVVHAWSRFAEAPGPDEDAENAAEGPEGERGVSPVAWTVARLDERVNVVTPEELVWRIRMAHRPEATRAAIAALER